MIHLNLEKLQIKTLWQSCCLLCMRRIIKLLAAIRFKIPMKKLYKRLFFWTWVGFNITQFYYNNIDNYYPWKRILRYIKKKSKRRYKQKQRYQKETLNHFVSYTCYFLKWTKFFYLKNLACHDVQTKSILKLITFLWWNILSVDQSN